MSYAQFSSIEALDYNTLVGGDPVTGTGKLNSVWGTGSGNKGYGQTPLANVVVGNAVLASSWANLVNKTANSGTHQGTSLTSVTAPASGNSIAYMSAIPTNLTAIYGNSLNAATQGGTGANSITYNSQWTTVLTATHIITFANTEAARYFFNAGGQLKVTASHANVTGAINVIVNGLAANIGSVALSSPVTGTANISSVLFNGVTKIGGGGPTPTISTNSGYFSLTTSNTDIFTQLADTGGGYNDTFINIKVLTNGTPGNVITIYTTWDEVPNGLTVGSGSTTTVTIVPPETTYLTSSWGVIANPAGPGNISITGSVVAT